MRIFILFLQELDVHWNIGIRDVLKLHVSGQIPAYIRTFPDFIKVGNIYPNDLTVEGPNFFTEAQNNQYFHGPSKVENVILWSNWPKLKPNWSEMNGGRSSELILFAVQ